MSTPTMSPADHTTLLTASPESESIYYRFEQLSELEWMVLAGSRHVGYLLHVDIVDIPDQVWQFVGLADTADQRQLWHADATRVALEAWIDYWFPQILGEAIWPGSISQP